MRDLTFASGSLSGSETPSGSDLGSRSASVNSFDSVATSLREGREGGNRVEREKWGRLKE